MRHSQILASKQLFFCLFRLVAIAPGRWRRRETNNLWAKSQELRSCCGGGRTRKRLTSEAGTARCFALQPVFKQHPDSFLIKHENPSSEHADPAVPALSFLPWNTFFFFSSPNVCNPKPHSTKTKNPFIKSMRFYNLWHAKETEENTRCLVRHAIHALHDPRIYRSLCSPSLPASQWNLHVN